ncbi:MAG: hypothetical protein KKD01_01745 [Proteobacteria bacterium]|nr:hypothetical protein [Pseudomonadota bacterium]MBU1138781.1 hypothetical protein [Pseudomonadota bacterium]MBU1233087.1 hypothetical protein [Pseudomonadota bacterium]MBU1419631.1 hypothetical protein [Pseudomonadota bacterium]MBU1453423.1 hypothetical protein [Pseudomonadota bacterium]
MNSLRQIFYFLLLFIAISLTILQPLSAESVPATAVKHDYTILDGAWQRTDGGYLITISDIQTDGRATVKYFNPNPIHIAQAAISTQKTLIKLFIQFQDKGYEGSTYNLYYYAEKDALVGFYYQAVMDKTFEVIFSRKTS